MEGKVRLSAIAALQAGDLGAALESVKDEVRNQPQEAKHRIFLFQLFAVTGEWKRALAQLKVASELSKDCETMADAYQHVLQCEALREQVFAGGPSPLILGEPEPWMAKVIEAARLVSQADYKAAALIRNQAFEEAPTSSGKLTLRSPDEQTAPEEHNFSWIADADSRFGPMLEVVAQGKYYWVPYQRIQQIQFHPVRDLRDCVWIPAQFMWAGGGEMVGMVPVRYPGSQQHAEGLIQLSRKTIWNEIDETTFLGMGQRILATSEDDVPLLDIDSIVFDVPAAPPQSDTP